MTPTLCERLRAVTRSVLNSGNADLCHEAADAIEALEKQVAEAKKDGEILDWLETKTVNVRTPLLYGSRDWFWASPNDDDGVKEKPSNLRAACVSAMREGKNGGAT